MLIYSIILQPLTLIRFYVENQKRPSSPPLILKYFELQRWSYMFVRCLRRPEDELRESTRPSSFVYPSLLDTNLKGFQDQGSGKVTPFVRDVDMTWTHVHSKVLVCLTHSFALQQVTFNTLFVLYSVTVLMLVDMLYNGACKSCKLWDGLAPPRNQEMREV